MSKAGDYAGIIANICKTHTGENKQNCLRIAFDCINVEYDSEDMVDFIHTRCDVNDVDISYFYSYYLDLV